MSNQNTQAAPAFEGAEIHELIGSSAPGAFAAAFPFADPDAELVQLGTRMAEVGALENRLRSAGDDGNQQEIDAVDAELDAGKARLRRMSASTWAGLAAKAAAVLEMHGLFDSSAVSESDELEIIRSLAQDVIRLEATPDDASGRPHTEAELVQLGQEFETAWAAELAIYRQHDRLEEADFADAHAMTESDATDRTGLIVDKIVGIPATTTAGVQVKARAFHWTRSGRTVQADLAEGSETTDATLMAGIVHDLRGLSAPSLGARLPLEALDAPIVSAWNEHQRLLPLVNAADEVESELWIKFKQVIPSRPDALLFRDTDFLKDSIRFVTTEVDDQSYYDGRAVKHLRASPRIRHEIVEEATAYPENDLSPVTRPVPNAEDQARADEIVAAWDAWQAEKDQIQEQIGIPTAGKESERLSAALHAAGDLIRDIPALSLKGIGIKAAWALQHRAEGEADLSGVLEQVEAFARRHAHLSQHSAEQTAAFERELAIPAADWELLRLFSAWLLAAVDIQEHDRKVDAEGALEDEIRAAETRARVLVRDMARLPAASIEGVRLKAHVFASGFTDSEGPADEHAMLVELLKSGSNDELMAFSMARDLSRLQPAACLDKLAYSLGVGRPVARTTLESYRTWLSNELRSLTAEMYPDHPEMTGMIEANNAGDRFHFCGEPAASTRAERVLEMFGIDASADRQVAA